MTHHKPALDAASHKQFPASIETTQIDGLKIRYARSERAGAETLLLLSPWPESLMAFLPTWSQFAKNYDVIAIDLPGFGHSEGRPDVIAPEAMGEFIVKVVKHFGLNRPHVVGPDVGTSTLLFAAANNPGIFSSITIGSGGVAYPLDVTSSLKEWIDYPTLEPLQNIDIPAKINATLSTLQHYKVPDFVREDYISSYSGKGRFAESARFVRLYPKELEVLKDRLPDIKTPVLVITGQHDPFVPVSNGQYVVERVPVSHLEIVNSGHLVWEDAADAYAGFVLDWVKKHKRH
ncbi:alpha/beta fold hydrolase [Pantoea sp. NPDC088449]|uniref:alpha/beta fold hydrolase n=1 Tax=Pantoea sp. NPDC088449 TaxID=3364392 RepID=UPI00380B767F